MSFILTSFLCIYHWLYFDHVHPPFPSLCPSTHCHWSPYYLHIILLLYPYTYIHLSHTQLKTSTFQRFPYNATTVVFQRSNKTTRVSVRKCLSWGEKERDGGKQLYSRCSGSMGDAVLLSCMGKVLEKPTASVLITSDLLFLSLSPEWERVKPNMGNTANEAQQLPTRYPLYRVW